MSIDLRLLLILGLLLDGCATTRSGSSLPATSGSSSRQTEIRELVRFYASQYEVAEDLILGVIAVESSFRPNARSHAGARGLMQLMPRTAASLAKRLNRKHSDIEDIITDPSFNIEAGTFYLAYLIKRFGSDRLALAAYNAGPARVSRWQRTGRPLPSYSRRYVAAVATARQRFTIPHNGKIEDVAEPDRQALRALLRRSLYGQRPNESLPDESS